jgi:hypothetical protein
MATTGSSQAACPVQLKVMFDTTKSDQRIWEKKSAFSTLSLKKYPIRKKILKYAFVAQLIMLIVKWLLL